MSDGLGPHPLGIEAVHWSSGAGAELVVRIAGRWRRRRMSISVPPVLVIDTEHQRYRFAAVPDPPSVRGAQPGLWQVSFTIPAWLGPYLSGRLTLLLGSVAISLPPAVSDPGEAAAPASSMTLADELERDAEPAEPEAALRVLDDGGVANAETKLLLDWLELELGRAREDAERLRGELATAERGRRDAEQLAHAESAIRLDLGRDHALRLRRHKADAVAVFELLQAAQIHARGLAHEVERLRRSADEAARPRRPESPVAGLASRARALASEMAIASSTPPAPPPAVITASAETPGLDVELVMQVNHAARSAPASPGRGRAAGARLEGALLHLAAERAVADERFARGPEDRARAAYVADAIEGIARQLDAARAAVALLPADGPAPVSRTMTQRDAGHAGVPGQSPGQPPAGSPGRPPGAVAPDRLAAALARLRQGFTPPESDRVAEAGPAGAGGPAAAPGQPSDRARSRAAELAAALATAREPSAARELAAAPEPAAAPSLIVPRTEASRWLQRTLKALLREDPALVGRVVVALLPAQGLLVAGRVRYDLWLSDVGCRAVTVGDDGVHVEARTTPRPLGEVDFRIEGDLAGLGRLLLYDPLRRRLSRRVARLRGDRRALAGLDWLVREPLGLHDLYAAGVRLEPELALLLVAHMIGPSWTAGERFTIGYQPSGTAPSVYLLVRDGARPRMERQPPPGETVTMIRCSDEQLLALLAGEASDEAAVAGASAAVVLLCSWIARAQRES